MMLPEGVGAALKASHPRYIGPGIGLQADSRALDPMILEPAGGIAGTVTDATGQPVAGAVVSAELIEHRARILSGGGEAMSDEQGRFLLGGLEPGVYNLLFHGVPGRPDAHGPGRRGSACGPAPTRRPTWPSSRAARCAAS